MKSAVLKLLFCPFAISNVPIDNDQTDGSACRIRNCTGRRLESQPLAILMAHSVFYFFTLSPPLCVFRSSQHLFLIVGMYLFHRARRQQFLDRIAEHTAVRWTDVNSLTGTCDQCDHVDRVFGDDPEQLVTSDQLPP